MRAWHVLGLVGLMATAGCSNLPEPQPMGPVKEAPVALQDLRIHVQNATSHLAREAGEDTVTGYELSVRGAVQRALAEAGYVVVVDPAAPRDALVAVRTAYQNAGEPGVRAVLVTSLRLTSGGHEVDQLAGVVAIDEGANIVARDAAAMVERLGRSPRLRRFAGQVSRPDVPCLKAMQLAGE